MMRKLRLRTVFSVAALTLAGCASSDRAPFDPSVDARIGEPVREACFISPQGMRGSYQTIDDRRVFVTRDGREQFVLVFSDNCRQLGNFEFPIFRNFGDRCRRTGEPFNTGQSGGGIGGACSIQQIYRWYEDAAADADAAEPDAAP